MIGSLFVLCLAAANARNSSKQAHNFGYSRAEYVYKRQITLWKSGRAQPLRINGDSVHEFGLSTV